MKNKFPSIIVAFILFFSSWVFLHSRQYSDLPEVKSFAKKVSQKRKIPYKNLISLFSQVTIKEKKIKQIFHLAANAKEDKSFWNVYKKHFVNKTRISRGKKFYRKNLVFLKKAEKKYQVPAPIIVATIGVETNYGRNLGDHNVLQTLCGHSFKKNRRKQFYQKELEYLLVLNQKEGLFDLKTLKGSYSGAIGPAQFMPRSLFYYAVDADKDNKRDMLENYQDIIMSVAFYYHRAKWKKGGKVVERLSVRKAKKALAKGQKNIIKLYLSNKKIVYYRYYPNFKAIKRYNNKNYYAMALYMLSRAISLKGYE